MNELEGRDPTAIAESSDLAGGPQTATEASTAAGAEDTPAASVGSGASAGEWPRNAIAEWTVTILLLLFGTTTLVQAFVIPTPSMEDTLLVGDHLLVDKLAYAPSGAISKYIMPYQEPKHGDIIVFRYPVDISVNYVKRVIGVPGDRIKIVNKQVYRNGVPLNEKSYVYYKTPYPDYYRDNFPSDPNVSLTESAREMLQNHVVNGEVVVPPDSYFAMGDNRDNSSDSRYWGFVPRANIVGKPLMIYWSYATDTQSLAGSSPRTLMTHFADLAQHFFTKTRWSRTLMLIHGNHSND
jgi:signal peptidase I